MALKKGGITLKKLKQKALMKVKDNLQRKLMNVHVQIIVDEEV